MTTDVLSILEAVAAVPGKNDKVAILQANKDNADLQQAFYLALNSLISFYIKKLPTAEEFYGTTSLSDGLDALSKLADRTYTGKAANVYTQNLLESLNQRDSEVVRRVLGRDLRIGASDGSADKVWPGLIPSFAVQLATSYSDKALARVKYPAFAQLKADGSRTQAIVDLIKREVSFWTRNGKRIFLSKAKEADMLALFPSEWTGTWVVDGEIVAFDASGVVDRATGNGIFNKAIKESISEAEEQTLRFQVWDLIEYSEWQAGKGTVPYKTRLDQLISLTHGVFTDVIETHTVNNVEEARAIYTTYIEQGLEGIILKNKAGLWVNDRSKDQVKFKQVISVDLELVQVIAGKAGKKYENVAGTLQGKTRCNQLLVDVSGMTDDERKWFWDNRESLPGIIFEAECNGVVKRKGSEVYSLFLPQYVRIRHDKNEANSLEELQFNSTQVSLK